MKEGIKEKELEIEGKNSEITDLLSQLEEALVDNRALMAINKHGASQKLLLPHVKKIIMVTQYIDRAEAVRIAPWDSITWLKTWNEALEHLTKDYPGKAKVAVIPDATIQYLTGS